jgi:hypothetical protein
MAAFEFTEGRLSMNFIRTAIALGFLALGVVSAPAQVSLQTSQCGAPVAGFTPFCVNDGSGSPSAKIPFLSINPSTHKLGLTIGAITLPSLTTPGILVNNGSGAVSSTTTSLFTPVTIFAYATCNGAAVDDAGLAAAATSGRTVFFPASAACMASSTATLGGGGIWIFDKGATLNIAATKTLTTNVAVEAGRNQIFTGAGAIVGIANVKPEWWGARGDYGNTFDSKPAFQAAINSAMGAFLPATPTFMANSVGTPRVDIGPGFFNWCGPLDIYPTPASPLEISGYGVWNAGTWLQPCATFVGGTYPNMINIHGVAVGTNNVSQLNFHDFSINNTSKTTGVTGAAIRFVPEGNGYWLNAFHKSSILRNIKISGFVTGLDIANTLQLRVQDSSFNSKDNTDTSNSVGVRIMSVGNNATGSNAGEITLDNIQTNLCPGNNVASCTATSNVVLKSDAANASVAAVSIVNSIFEPANYGILAQATGGGTIGDIWIQPGTQFDGYGCEYLHFEAQSGSSIFDIHADHVYHTGGATSCISHHWWANGGSVYNIWDTNNHFILGPSGTVINFDGVTGFQATGNIIDGTNAGTDAIQVLGSAANGVVSNNVIKGTWRWGVLVNSGVTNTTALGNNCKGSALAATCAVDQAALTGVTNNVFGNGDRPFAYTPVVTCVGGTPTYTTTGTYNRVDNAMTVAVDVTVSASTCTGRMQISLPRAPFGTFPLTGTDSTTAIGLQGQLPDSDANMYITKYDGTGPVVAGHTYHVTATYLAR